MINATTSSTSTQTTLTTTTPTQTKVPSDSNLGSGLSASAKGGIVGGVVGAVLVTSIIFLIFFFLRRRKRHQGIIKGEDRNQKDGDERTNTEPSTTGQTCDRSGEGEVHGVPMLASREKLELDGFGRALHEMESPTSSGATAITKNENGSEKVRTTRMAELPGSFGVVAEMPVTDETERKGE
ncbi:hypothetical protein BJX70DRAFT_64358 [Aspergillus crustosus]